MHDPTTHGNIMASVTTSVPAMAAGVSVLQVGLWPFGIAFISGGIALIYLERMQPKDAFFSIVGSTLLGGALSQLGAYIAGKLIPSLMPSLNPLINDEYGAVVITISLAILIGLFAQKAMPALFKRAEKTIGGANE